MRLRNLILAGVTAASLIPAAASAQSWGYDNYGRYGGYEQRRDYDRDDRRDEWRQDDRRGDVRDLLAREDRLGDWIRRSSQEGRLDNWRARRAWEEYRSLREDTRRLTYGNNGYGGGYRDLYRRLDRLTDFLRDARRDRGDYR